MVELVGSVPGFRSQGVSTQQNLMPVQSSFTANVAIGAASTWLTRTGSVKFGIKVTSGEIEAGALTVYKRADTVNDVPSDDDTTWYKVEGSACDISCVVDYPRTTEVVELSKGYYKIVVSGTAGTFVAEIVGTDV